MKKISSPTSQIIDPKKQILASIGFMALTSTLLLVQGISRLIVKNF